MQFLAASRYFHSPHFYESTNKRIYFQSGCFWFQNTCMPSIPAPAFKVVDTHFDDMASKLTNDILAFLFLKTDISKVDLVWHEYSCILPPSTYMSNNLNVNLRLHHNMSPITRKPSDDISAELQKLKFLDSQKSSEQTA